MSQILVDWVQLFGGLFCFFLAITLPKKTRDYTGSEYLEGFFRCFAKYPFFRFLVAFFALGCSIGNFGSISIAISDSQMGLPILGICLVTFIAASCASNAVYRSLLKSKSVEN